MAEIPVEKKSSYTWLWILLLLLLAAAFFWWLLSSGDADPNVPDTSPIAGENRDAYRTSVDDGVPLSAPVGDNSNALTDLATLSSLAAMIGSEVDLENVAVNRVIGDMAFTVGEGGSETLVRFDEVHTPETQREGLVDINPGSRVDIVGEVLELDLANMPDTVRADLDDAGEAYIRAHRVNVINGGETP